MNVSQEDKTESRAAFSGKIMVGALFVLIGGGCLAYGLTTWADGPVRGLGFTVLAVGAAFVAALMWGREPEPVVRRLRRTTYGLVCAAVVLIAVGYTL